MPHQINSWLSRAVLALVLAVSSALVLPLPAAAQEPEVTGQIDWGLWIDPDGCMHWWADGGIEGYMLPRRDPKTGKHMCLTRKTCATPNADALFVPDSERLTDTGRAWLEEFFAKTRAVAFDVYANTDNQAPAQINLFLSQRRANAIAGVARAQGKPVVRAVGVGDRRPVAPNDTAENMQKNRRVELICYR